MMIFLELFVNTGFFLRLGSYDVTYSETTLLFISIITLFLFIRNAGKIKLRVSLLVFLFSVIITELYLAINPINDYIYRNGLYVKVEISFYSIIIFLRVLMIIFISAAAIHTFSKNRLDMTVKKLSKWAFSIYLICYIEWLVKNIFNSSIFNAFVNFIFGKGANTVDFLLERGSLFSLQGLTKEPAHLAHGVFIFLVIILLSNLKAKEKQVHFMLGGLILLISGSFSGFGYFFTILIMYFYTSKHFTYLRLAFVVVFACLVITLAPSDLISYYFMRAENTIESLLKPENVSFVVLNGRVFSMHETFKTVVLKRPLIGAGLGIPYAYSANLMIVASIGITGFVTWFYYFFLSIGNAIERKKTFFIILFFSIFMLIGSINIIYSGYTLLITMELNSFGIKHKESLKKSPALAFRT